MSLGDFPYSLLAPGPVNIHPEVREVLALPMIHHRTPEFDSIFKRVREGLKPFFGTKENVYILTSTGSGGMEALLVNTMSIGDPVLVIQSGKFGERWAEMCEVYGLKVHKIEVPWGHAIDPFEVKNYLKLHPEIQAVLCQACETSTGVAHPIKELGEIIHEHENTLFLVDGITAVGAYTLLMDDWYLDGVVAGSQKAFMLPTGLSFVALSKKAQIKQNKSNLPKYYFELKREEKANSNGETFFSSSVSLIRALDKIISLIEAKGGLSSLQQVIQLRAEYTRRCLEKIGLQLFTSSPSWSLSAFKLPDYVDGQKIRSHLESKYLITIMGGQDQLKGKILRIGHMGYIQANELLQVILGLGRTFIDLYPQSILAQQAHRQWEDECKNELIKIKDLL